MKPRSLRRHLGVVPYLVPEAGGIYQYSLSVLDALRGLPSSGRRHAVTIVADAGDVHRLRPYVSRDWNHISGAPANGRDLVMSAARRMVGEGPHREAWRMMRRLLERVWPTPPRNERTGPRPDLTRWYLKHEIELMLHTAAYPLVAPAFAVGIPYVLVIHDLQHRLRADISEDAPWIDDLHRLGARDATLVVVDSEVGKEDLLRLHERDGVCGDRIRVLPYCPPPYIGSSDVRVERDRVRLAYRLPQRYLFYPAQFWRHKNHIGIVRALASLRNQDGLRIPVVLCGEATRGAYANNFRDMMADARSLGVQEQVVHLGYVPNEHINGLYAAAEALIMPTFFGPTNLPVCEAWAMGCPVITSRIRGIREHVGEAGMLVNPDSPTDIAAAMRQIWLDGRLREELACLGRRRVAQYTPNDFRSRLSAILDEAFEQISPRRVHVTDGAA